MSDEYLPNALGVISPPQWNDTDLLPLEFVLVDGYDADIESNDSGEEDEDGNDLCYMSNETIDFLLRNISS